VRTITDFQPPVGDNGIDLFCRGQALPEPSRSLAHLLVFTGLRIGELLALRWCDVDLERCGLRVTQSVYDGHFDEPKSQRSKRSILWGQSPSRFSQLESQLE
jgi:integrase